MFNKLFNKKGNGTKVLDMFLVEFSDGSTIEMDEKGVNMMLVHDYNNEIVRVNKI